MAKSGGFSINSGAVGGVTKRIMEIIGMTDKVLQIRMDKVVKIIYATATARRPKIERQRTSGGKLSKAYRVSDPSASYGVPVKTGNLKSSIKKEVYRSGGKVVGRIWVDLEKAPYATAVEFGHKIGKSSKTTAPRPFMRQALELNKGLAEKEFNRVVDYSEISKM